VQQNVPNLLWTSYRFGPLHTTRSRSAFSFNQLSPPHSVACVPPSILYMRRKQSYISLVQHHHPPPQLPLIALRLGVDYTTIHTYNLYVCAILLLFYCSEKRPDPTLAGWLEILQIFLAFSLPAPNEPVFYIIIIISESALPNTRFAFSFCARESRQSSYHEREQTLNSTNSIPSPTN
jgi:hypothetical protein